MNYPWNYYNFYHNWHTNPYYVNGFQPIVSNSDRLKVQPLNINLTVNSNKNFKVYQPSKIISTNEGLVVVPEINLNITFNNNFRKNKPYKKNNHKSDKNKPVPNRHNQNKPVHNKPKSDIQNLLGTDFASNMMPKGFNGMPGAKIIEIDAKDLKGKNPFEAIFNKLLGIDRKDNKIAEAPLKKELNFDLTKEYDELPFSVKTLDDLINLADLYEDNDHKYGFNMKRLKNIKESLIRLNNIIGMKEVKQKIADKLITYLQGLGDMDDMNHIVIQAPPGYGKTMLGFHLSEIFYKLGLIKVVKKEEDTEYTNPFNGEKIDFPFIVAKRKDLIGEYVGHTAPKVEKMVEKALGGVLFIDEAYSLGSSSNESYSEEAINTLNQLLSEKAGQFICIIAGYKEQLKKSFFINQGLERRFRMIFEIEKYSEEELALIFNKMVYDKKWSLDEKLIKNKLEKLIEFMEKNNDMFKFCGGDMETLLQNVRDAHSKRVFGKHPKEKKIITLEDLNEGFKLFEKSIDRQDEHYNNRHVRSMYV